MANRREFLLGAGGAAATLALVLGEAEAASKYTLVYISAANCPNCSKFYYSGGLGNMKSLLASKSVEYKSIDVRRFQNYSDDPFPSDLAWLKAHGVSRGAPRFVLISGNRIVKNVNGASKYNSQIRPLIEQS